MHCPKCGKLIEDDLVLPVEINCPFCGITLYIDLDRAYGDQLEDGFMLINPYNTEAYA